MRLPWVASVTVGVGVQNSVITGDREALYDRATLETLSFLVRVD